MNNIVDAVHRKQAAAYYGDQQVDKYGYSHLPNAADADGSDLLVLMHPQAHADDGHLARVVPQELPPPPKLVVPSKTASYSYSHSAHERYYSHAPSSSAMANLNAAISAVLGGTPTAHVDVERVKEERFAANGVKKFRGVTRHKRTLRFEAHIWESKKQIYLGGFESELLAARSHDVMALKCKGLDWGALNFDKADYEQVIEVLDKVEKEDIIFTLRDFSKLFGDAEGGHGSRSGTSAQSHVTKGGHASNLKPALKIRKQTDHHGGAHHHGKGNGNPLPRTPSTPYQGSPFNSTGSGAAPITPKDKTLDGINVDRINGADPAKMSNKLGSIGGNAALFDPAFQPVDDGLCSHGNVFLPDTSNAQESSDPFSMIFDILDDSPAEDSGGGSGVGGGERLVSDDILDNAWQWSHC